MRAASSTVQAWTSSGSASGSSVPRPTLRPTGGEAGADGGRVGGDRRLGLAHPLGALGRRGLLQRLAELLQGHDVLTSSLSRLRSTSIACGTVSCAAWAWRESSTATSPSYPISTSALKAAASVELAVAEHQVLVHAADHVLDVHVDEPVGAARRRRPRPARARGRRSGRGRA